MWQTFNVVGDNLEGLDDTSGCFMPLGQHPHFNFFKNMIIWLRITDRG